MATTQNHHSDSWIATELQSDNYHTFLDLLQRQEPFLRSFGDWNGIVAFMRNAKSPIPQKELILRNVCAAHHADTDPRWRTILLAVFWPGLKSLCWQKRHWDTDAEELWQNIVWSFLETVTRLDPAKRPARLAQKIINDTVHRMGDIYRKKWAIANAEVSYDTEEGESLLGGKDDIDYWTIELHIRQESAIRHLRKYLLAGVINEEEFLLIVGTRIYGKSVSNYASDVGLDYELARKRRQRAEAKLGL